MLTIHNATGQFANRLMTYYPPILICIDTRLGRVVDFQGNLGRAEWEENAGISGK